MLTRIEALRDQFRPSERKLADYVLAQPGEVINLHMADLAKRVGVSEPTIARFCATLGCSGFREFKIKLAQNIAGGMPFIHQDVRPEDRAEAIIGKLADRTINNLMKVRANLSASAVERAADLMARARRIEFYGAGNSGIVAQDIQHKFFRLGIPTVAYIDPHVYNMSALSLSRGDVVVTVSNSGRAQDIIESAENALSVGADVIALTCSGSPLARIATVALLSDVVEDADIFVPMTSRMAHLLIGDILTVAVALRKGEALQERLARNKQAVRQRRIVS